MNEGISKPGPADFSPPVSSFSGPIAELIGHRMLAPPTRPGMLATLDHFEILRIVGSGGMGIVFLARDPENGTEVAIKLIKPELATDATMTHRFVKEANHMQRLKHKGIAPVLDISRDENRPYFVMPYFSRGNLARVIRPGSPLDREFILEIAAQIGEGLQFAHQRGIIHRDFKPANILMSAGCRACLSDFGLARTIFNDTFVDVENQPIEGTVIYMSPAVAAGQAEDTRCDIYSFGAVLYEMLTGEPPYSGRTTREIRAKIIAGPPVAIKVVNPAADANLVFVAESAMGRELRDRYAAMTDVLADLGRISERKTLLGPHGASRGAKGARVTSRRYGRAILALAVAAFAFTIGGFLLYRSRSKPISLPQKKEVPVAVDSHSPPGPLYFEHPCGIAADPAGNIYIIDDAAYSLTKITATGVVSLLAGRKGMPGISDGENVSARFSLLRGIAIDDEGDLFVSDAYRIRKLSSVGLVSTLAGVRGSAGVIDGSSRVARFDRPSGLSTDHEGDVYVADDYTIRKVTAGGVVSTLAGVPGHSGDTDGQGRIARFSDQTKGLVVDPNGSLFLADGLNCTIRKITREGMVSTIAGVARQAGSEDGEGKQARFSRPGGVAIERSGIIYIADTFNHTIRKITPNGMVSTVAGAAGKSGDADGAGANARFDFPEAVAVDGGGNIFVADTGNHRVRKISPTGEVSTLRGQSL